MTASHGRRGEQLPRRGVARWSRPGAPGVKLARQQRGLDGAAARRSARSCRRDRRSAPRRRRGLRPAGSAIVQLKVEPRPGALSTQISPPIASTRRLEIASPRPVPPKRRPAPASACSNSSKMRACASRRDADAGIADAERQARRSPCRRSTTTATPPVSVNLIGIADEVEQNLAQPGGVADEARAAAGRRRTPRSRCPWRGRAAPAARPRPRPAGAARRARGSSSSRPASILEKSRMSSISDSQRLARGFHRLGIGRPARA